MTFRRVLASLSLITLMAANALAQEFRGTINGRVTDPSGTGVANAKITLTNLATNDTAVVNTTDNGDYTAPFVLPGRYSISAEANGFRKALRSAVEVRISEKVTADFQLEVGAVTESVTVTSEAPLVDETTADRGGILDNVRITQLPVIGRN